MNMLKIHQRGAVVLIFTVVLMTATLAILVYAANYVNLQQKRASNQAIHAQAFNAADAGIEFGLQYLSQNSTTIKASQVGGVINYGPTNASLTNVTLANNSRFSVVYTNPTTSNYKTMLITSTGTSADGTSSEVLRQYVYAGIPSLKYAITVKGNFISSGNVTITGPSTLRTGGNYTASGNNSILNPLLNDSALSSQSTDALFLEIFGITKAAMQAQSTYYATTSGINYGTLSGRVWINTTVVLSGNYTIGTIANPVLLIINGSLVASGNITVNGLIYVAGNTTTSGNVNYNGGMITEGNITMSGAGTAYNADIVTTFTPTTYGKIPGSWRDF